MPDKLRIGFIGAGGNTRLRHIPGLKALPDVELVWVCNRSMESGQKVASEFGIEKVTADPDDTLESLAQLMSRNRIKRLLIVRGDELLGLVSRADLVRAIAGV